MELEVEGKGDVVDIKGQALTMQHQITPFCPHINHDATPLSLCPAQSLNLLFTQIYFLSFPPLLQTLSYFCLLGTVAVKNGVGKAQAVKLMPTVGIMLRVLILNLKTQSTSLTASLPAAVADSRRPLFLCLPDSFSPRPCQYGGLHDFGVEAHNQ